MKRIWKRPKLKPMVMLATVFVFVLFVLLLQQGLWSRARIQPPVGTLHYVESGWTMEDETGTLSEQVEMHHQTRLRRGTMYSITKTLTYDGSRDEMPYGFFHVDHMFCRVLLDGEVLFSYMPEDVRKWDRSKSPGFILKALPLPRDCQGRELRVEFLPVLDVPVKYEIPEVELGDFRSITRTMIARDLPHNIITVLCMMMGITALIFSAVSLSGSDYREGFNIGSFTLLVSLYFLTECETNFYYIANPYYLYFVNFTVFSLMPVSLMGVMRECMEGKQRKICTGVIAAEMSFFLLEITLHLTGVLDMREARFAIHVIGIGEMGILSVLFLCMKDRKKRIAMQLQMTPVIIGMVIDVLLYWKHWNVGVSDSTFTTIGVQLYLAGLLIRKLVHQARKLTNMQQHTIEGMATLIESRDGSTGAHVRNTGVYARMIAEEMYHRRMYPKEINSEFVDMIGRMAPLHDVGKIKISDTILNKPGRFTPEEYEIMKTHAAMGGEIIREIMRTDLDPDMLEMAVNIATYHHERWDGKGYPTGKQGTEIPLCARIMAAADVFDALSSKRVYKPEMDIDQVFHEMVINEDKQFQKEIVEVVVSLRPQLEAYLEKNKKAAAKQKQAAAI